MRILALYPSLPYPLMSGTKLRGSAILDILTLRHDVVLASFVSPGESPSQLLSWKTYARFAQEPLTVPRESDEELSSAGKQLKAMFPRPRFGMPEWLDSFDSPAMWNRLAGLDIQKLDAVHVRYISMAPYALALKRAVPHLRLVIDLDDILSMLFYRKLAYPKKISRVREFLWEVKELLRMYDFECGPLRRFDSVWICSKPDFDRMSRRHRNKRVLIVENVVDVERLTSVARKNTGPVLLFIGDFNYDPNRQGAEFFVTKVWPLIRSKIPEAQLWLVGANRQKKMLEWNGQQGITVTGTVEDVLPYLEGATVSIAPIFVGAGTRLKILEAFGAGLPVVTTSVGAEGIEAKNGVDLLIADTAEEFAEHCIHLLRDPAFREQLAESGKSLVREKYDISVMSRTVLKCYELLDSRVSDDSHVRIAAKD